MIVQIGKIRKKKASTLDSATSFLSSYSLIYRPRSYRPKRIHIVVKRYIYIYTPQKNQQTQEDITAPVTRRGKINARRQYRYNYCYNLLTLANTANTQTHLCITYIYLYTHTSRIIGSEHLSYKIVMDTCQGNIKLGSSTQNHLRVRLHYARYMHMHVQDILVDRDGKLRYHARPRASLMRCGLTPLCFPTPLSLPLLTSIIATQPPYQHTNPNYTVIDDTN